MNLRRQHLPPPQQQQPALHLFKQQRRYKDCRRSICLRKTYKPPSNKPKKSKTCQNNNLPKQQPLFCPNPKRPHLLLPRRRHPRLHLPRHRLRLLHRYRLLLLHRHRLRQLPQPRLNPRRLPQQRRRLLRQHRLLHLRQHQPQHRLLLKQKPHRLVAPSPTTTTPKKLPQWPTQQQK